MVWSPLLSRIGERRGLEIRVTGIKGSNHTGFQVSDLEESVRFYCDVLGLELIARRIVSESYIGDIVGYPGVVLNVAYMRIPDSEHLLELLEYQNVSRTAVDPQTANPGTAHLCFVVDDLLQLYDLLRSRGARFVGPPVMVTHGPNQGRYALYMLDPDAIRLELVERHPTV